MNIPTDKILSEEERKSIEMDFRVEGFSVRDVQKLISSEFQLAALCRAQEKAIEDLRPLAICLAENYASALGAEFQPAHDGILEQAEELLAAFPETLKEK